MDDKEKAIHEFEKFYHMAIRTNDLHPGMIRCPAAWALYNAWRKIDDEAKMKEKEKERCRTGRK